MKYFSKRSSTYCSVLSGKEHKVAISSPVIVAELASCPYKLIDGQHRIESPLGLCEVIKLIGMTNREQQKCNRKLKKSNK